VAGAVLDHFGEEGLDERELREDVDVERSGEEGGVQGVGNKPEVATTVEKWIRYVLAHVFGSQIEKELALTTPALLMRIVGWPTWRIASQTGGSASG
jgi:hypothetical protein